MGKVMSVTHLLKFPLFLEKGHGVRSSPNFILSVEYGISQRSEADLRPRSSSACFTAQCILILISHSFI